MDKRSRHEQVNRRRLGATTVAAAALLASLGGVSLGAPALAAEAGKVPQGEHKMGATSTDNVVLRWNSAALEAVRTSKLGPPMVSRALAIMHTCMYDAWSAYDARAAGTQMGATLRRPSRERTLGRVNKAVSFAAYRAAVDLFADKAMIFDHLMKDLHFQPADRSTDTTKPAGIGNVACQKVLEFRHRDGANQLGDEPGGTPGLAYSDYTGYKPVNKPMNLAAPFDPATVRDPNRWQPLTYTDGTGTVVTPKFLAPFWNRVTPFAMSSTGQLRSPVGPPSFGSDEFVREQRELVDLSANLTDEQKMIAEYWADGPKSELPPGHWNLFAQHVSRRDHHGPGLKGVEADVKMFFAMNNAIFDAGIVAWDNKVVFDSVRPITAIRYLFRGQKVKAWAGPGQGTKLINGEDWLPYQPSTFPTPPFADYSSGHSNFSGAGAQVLRLFTHSDRFGLSVKLPKGSSKVEPGAVPAKAVTLSWKTFSQATAQAGISRRYGGIHPNQADREARETGRRCANQAWVKAQALFGGA